MDIGRRPLFSSLYKWVHRQQENFTTESLGIVLRALAEEHPDHMIELLSFLSGGVFPQGLSQNDQLSITTQVHSREKEDGITDLEIRTSNCLLIIEAKLDAYTGKGQLEAYLKKAEKESLNHFRLTLLSRYPDAGVSVPNGVHVLRWYELAEKLREICEKIRDIPLRAVPDKSAKSPSQYLASDYLDFLLERGLAIPEVKSELSGAVREFVKLHGEQILEKKRYRSLGRVGKEYPELKGLISILRLMEQSLAVLPKKSRPRFDTGKHQGGWLGFNIGLMEYFYCIYLKEPEMVYFEAYKRKLVPDKWDKESGDTYETKHGTYWRNKLDLEKSQDFFNRPASTQLGILERFVRTSYELAQRFTEE